MEVTYQLTVDDYHRAIKAYRTRTAFLRWMFRAGVGVMVLAFSAGILLFVLEPHGNAIKNLLPLLVVCALWSFSLWAAPHLSARRQFRGSPSANNPVTLEASDAGLHFRTAHSDSRGDWTAYVRWLEEERVFAVFPNSRIFIAIPKRAFTADQVSEFRELLREKIKRQ